MWFLSFFLLFAFHLHPVFSENIYIRAFDLGGIGLKTVLFFYDQETQKMELIEEVIQLGHCPEEEAVSSWLRDSMKKMVGKDLDQEIQCGYLFGFSLAGLDKLCSKPLSTFDLSIICNIPQNKVRCIGDEIAHLISSLHELRLELPKGPIWNFSIGTHVGIGFTDIDHQVRKLSDLSALDSCDPRYTKEPTTGLSLGQACGSTFGFDRIVRDRKGLLSEGCYIEFAKRWKAYLEASLFLLSRPELFPGAIIFTGGHIETHGGHLIDDLIQLGVSVPLFMGPKNAGLLGAAWNAVKCDNSINELGQTELTKAIALKNRGEVESLLKNGADLNQRDALGYTPLTMAIEVEELQLLELLIEYGALLNIRSVSGASPLLCAVQKNNYKMVEVLLKNGADSGFPDYWNQLPIDLAKKNSNQAIQVLLENY